MPLTLGSLLVDAGIDPAQALVLRHAYVREHEDSGLVGLHADSTHAEILEYTRNQSTDVRKMSERFATRPDGGSGTSRIST